MRNKYGGKTPRMEEKKEKDSFERISIPFPLELSSVEEMISAFDQPSVTLDLNSVTNLISAAKSVFQKCPFVVDIQVPKDGRLIVVGGSLSSFCR